MIHLDDVDNFVDGAVVRKVGKITFDFCKKYLDEIVVVDEGEICYNDDVFKKRENYQPAGANENLKIKLNKNVMCIIAVIMTP